MKLIVCSLLLVNFAVYIQTRSVTNVGDIHIEQSDDKWICDMIECPQNTHLCYISKSNYGHRSVLERVNICFSKDYEILAQKNTSSPIDPNHQVHKFVNSFRIDGPIPDNTYNFNDT